MNTCTNKKLNLFGREHYTYINQIFGDETVREIIKECYSDRDWKFAVEDTIVDGGHSNHLILMKKGKMGEDIQWCSVEEGFQNTLVNKNDTLCQSYSLMKYLNKPIPIDMTQRQLEMIRMYRKIMTKTHFKTHFKDMIDIMQAELKRKKIRKHVVLWEDYTVSEVDEDGYDIPIYLNESYEEIYEEIENVLDKWEKYGYLYFMKDGTCSVKRVK